MIFPIAGNNEKKYIFFIRKTKKKIWCRTWMGYCPIELKAGLGTGCAGGARSTQARRGSGAHGRWALGRARHVDAGQARGKGAWQGSARGTAGWAAWARLGRAAKPMGCALGALGLFLARFDSVFS